MPQKNLTTDIIRKFGSMPDFLYRSRFIIALIFAAILLLSGCKKKGVESISINTLQAYFETNILNKNFIVDLATDSTKNITSEYTGYSFILTKTTSYLDGPMNGTKEGITYSGTWSCNEDYSKLIINLTSPTVPTAFIFLNRAWRFTSKSDLNLLKLAPWGSTDPKVLYMRRQ